MPPRRELNPRFQAHIARAKRTRVIAGAFLGLCLLGGTAAALGRPILAQLPQQANATLEQLSSGLHNSLSQLPTALSARIQNFTAQLPTRTQLAAAATSFPQSLAEKARNLFCRWLGCKARDLADSSRILNEDLTGIGSQQRATIPQNVKQPELSPPARRATTTSVVVSKPAFPQTTINQPVIERIRETVRTIVQGGIDEAFVDARLAALNTDLTSRMTSLASANSSQTTNVYNTVAAALRIEELSDLILHNPVIDGGSITAASITGTLSNAISSALATITALTSTTITATNASTTVASSLDGLFVGRTSTTTILGSATSTFGAGIQATALNVTSTSATSTFANGIRLSGGCFQLADGTCAGTGSGSGLTFGKAWEVSGNFLAPTTTLYVTNIQQASSTLFSANRAWFGSTATTTIDAAGNVAVAGTLDVTGKATLGNASSTNLSATYASSTSGFFGSLSVGNLSGFLKATAGAIATAAIDLASDVTGILGVARGGTGWANVAAGAVPYGNGAGALATTTAGTAGQVLALLNGVPTWAATTTLSTITGTISGTQLDGVFSSNGLLARTTTGTYASRTLTGTANQIAVANGDGVSGNPTFSLPSLLFITNASSTQQSIFDRLYVGGSATTTIRGDGIASTIPFASSTALTISGTASTTNLIVSSAGGATGCAQFSVTGLISNTGTACGSGGAAFPFTPTTNFGANTSATSTALSLFGGLNASSTIRFGNAGVSGFLFESTTGNLGLGTTTPWAQLSINPNGITGPSFVIGSSTATNFIVTNSGNVGIGTTSPSATFAVNGTMFVTGTSTHTNGINLTSGCFALNGTCIGNIVKLTAVRTGTSTAQWSVPAGLSYAIVELWGGGGGGGRASLGSGGGNGGNSNFGGLATSTGGSGGQTSPNAAGSGQGGDVNLVGYRDTTPGSSGSTAATGGCAPRGGCGTYQDPTGQAYGGGGGNNNSGSGGYGGGYMMKLYSASALSATTSVQVLIGAGGTAGSSGFAGGAGGYVIYEYTTQLGGNDFAETYPVSDPSVEAGDIVSFDTSSSITIKRAARGDDALAGIISTAPGQVLGDKDAVGQRPVALSGRVPVKFSNENGDVQIGDRIALSSTPGVGMKAGPFDSSVGIAITPYDAASDDGTVMLFIDLQRGFDVTALGDALLASTANDNPPTSTAPATEATTTATSTPSYSYLNSFLKNLFALFARWLADAQNGITDFFAQVAHFRDTYTQRLCVTDSATDPNPVCVTKPQLAALLSQSAVAATPISVPSQASNIRDVHSPESVSSTSTPDVASSTPEALPIEAANDNALVVPDTNHEPASDDTSLPSNGANELLPPSGPAGQAQATDF